MLKNIEIYNENETKLTKIPYSFSFFRFQNMQKLLDQQKKTTLFHNSFIVDEIDDLSELL